MQALDYSDAIPQAVIALGANLPGDGATPAQTLVQALDLIVEFTGTGGRASRLFSAPAFPPGAGPDFRNAAASFPWQNGPEALLALLHRVEAALGRTRSTRWAARIVDLDLIALGDLVWPDADTQRHWAALPPEEAARQTPERLIVPHPRMAERSFVLVPMADIAPDWRHPLTGRSVAGMLDARPAAERATVRPVAWPGADAPSPLSFGPPEAK